MNEAGDSTPSSQDSVTRAVQNLRISDSLAASVAKPPPAMGNSRRGRPGNTFAVRSAAQLPTPTGRLLMGPMQHTGQKHRGRTLLEDRVEQQRWLNRQAYVHCGTIRSQRCRRCVSCGFDTPLRELRVGDTLEDRRQPGHQDAAASGLATGQQLPQSLKPVPPGEPLDDSPLPNCLIRDVVLTDRFKHLLTELRRASAMALPRCVVSRCTTTWAESL